MATTRPVVSFYAADGSDKPAGTTKMPTVFQTPLRPDLVRSVYTGMSKNKRQAYGVYMRAGYGYAAESWGTGRALARIPRTSGSGQGAFGNMCRGGGMFNPNATWRRWHRRVNVTEKRHAVASAVAASALPALVMARGHRVEEVPELPLVLNDSVAEVTKTKAAIELMENLGLGADLAKVRDSKKLHTGRGKSRNRRYTMKRGPLIVYEQDDGITKAVRNIPGVEVCHVDRLNLLKLAPGGTFGRLIVWTKSAFDKLETIYGSYTTPSAKKGYTLMRAAMTNTDIARIINSDEVQAAVKPAQAAPKTKAARKMAFSNRGVLARLVPGAAKKKAALAKEHVKDTKQSKLVKHKVATRKAAQKKVKGSGKKFVKALEASYEQ